MVDLIATGDAAVAESYWRGHLLEGRQYFGQRNAKQLVAGI
jgi:hypothetical protein